MGFTAGYKLNEGTLYEFTVSDETIAEVIAAEGGITEADIAPYCYTALIDSRIHSVFLQSSKNVNAAGFDSWQADNMPYYFIRDTRYVNSNTAINKNDTVYERNFLVWNGTIYPGEENEKTGTFLVMDIADIKRWYVDFNAGMFSADTFTSAITEGGVTSPFPGYNGSGYTYVSNTADTPVIHCDNNDPMQNPEENLHIINVLVINNDLWIGHLNPASHGDANTGIIQSTYNIYLDSYVNGYLKSGNPTIYQAGSDSWSGIGEIKEMNYPDLGSRTTVYKSYVESSDGVLMEINGNSGGTFDVRTDSGSHCKDLNTLLKWQSWCGLKFTYDNIMYKPIIEQGVIIGYTDDMSTPSEYDTMTNVTGNNISPVPPGPVPPTPGDDDDNTDPVSTADAPFGSGIAHYYAMTADSVLLQHVSEALGTWDIDSSKKDLYRNLISCKLIKPPAPIPTSGSEDFTIYGVVPQYQGAAVKLPVINGNPSNTFGPYTISRKFNDFRDFAPYSKAEIFLPYCGWTALPSHVIGRSVTVKYFTDIIAATCKAVVFCNNNVVAEAAGIIGLDIPFASENVGAKMEAANMGLLASTLGAVQTAVGVGSMVSTKSGSGLKNVTSGLSQVISGCTQISMAGNENWTEINGKAGDGCCLSGITDIIIKITRPKYGSYTSPPYVPSGYAHNIGYVAMKQTKPGNVTGLLVCDNVDTSGISGATQRERELIKAYMESGIIVNAAPSS